MKVISWDRNVTYGILYCKNFIQYYTYLIYSIIYYNHMGIRTIQKLYLDHQYFSETVWFLYADKEDCIVTRTIHNTTWHAYYSTIKWHKISNNRKQQLDALAVAPSRTHVRYHPDHTAHLQAVATDQQWNTQYIYHPEWTRTREHIKQLHLYRFWKKLENVRQWYSAHLQPKSENMSMATLLCVLDNTGMRAGNMSAYSEHGTSWITTIPLDAISIHWPKVYINILWKSEQELSYTLKYPGLKPLIKKLRAKWEFVFDETPSQVQSQLDTLTWWWHSIKDFRTWRINTLAVDTIRNQAPETITDFLDRVTQYSQNTPSIAQSHYIYDGLTDIVRSDAISRFKSTYRWTKPTKSLEQSEHILLKYMKQEVEKFSWISLNLTRFSATQKEK